jgi:putative chitobiose transport system permease protein
MTATSIAEIRVAERGRRRTSRGSRWLRNGAWYVVLTAMAFITVFPFAWMFLTSIKGPADPITSVPPQFLPNDPTLAAYARVWDSLPIASYFLNSTTVAVATGLLNMLVAALAAYPLAKMRFAGREFVF